MTLQQVKAINTVGGMARFSVVVWCELEEFSSVKQTLEKCGLGNISTGFVHCKTPANTGKLS